MSGGGWCTVTAHWPAEWLHADLRGDESHSHSHHLVVRSTALAHTQKKAEAYTCDLMHTHTHTHEHTLMHYSSRARTKRQCLWTLAKSRKIIVIFRLFASTIYMSAKTQGAFTLI